MRRHSSSTLSLCPAPMRLLTSELAVDANALTNMKMNDETLRTMLEMASGRSPRCSMATKKKSQAKNANPSCAMIHTETLRIRPSSGKSMPRQRNSP